MLLPPLPQALPSLTSYGSHGNLALAGLQAQLAQAAALQQQLGGAGAAPSAANAGGLDGSSPSQLISLLSANAAAAAAAAGAAAPILRSSPSMGQLSLSRGSSHNDLVGLLAQQQQQQQAADAAAAQQLGAGKPPLPSGWHQGGMSGIRSMGGPSVQGTVGPASARAGALSCPPALPDPSAASWPASARAPQQSPGQPFAAGPLCLRPTGLHALIGGSTFRLHCALPSGAQSLPAATPPPSAGPRIFVGKLNKDTSEQDVKDYFIRFGYVMDVYLPRGELGMLCTLCPLWPPACPLLLRCWRCS